MLPVLLVMLAQVAQAAERPNVLFIAIDDLRNDLGAYGHPVVKSPNIDRLAAEGVRFDRHFVTVPTCGASRHSLLTGMLPSSPEALSNKASELLISDMPEQASPESFVHQLRRHGYTTVGIGKVSHRPDGLIYEARQAASQKRELPHSWDEMIFDAGQWGTGSQAFFGYADGSNRWTHEFNVKPFEAAEVDDEGYPDGLSANLAIEKLQQLADQDQPFFLAVGFFKPHLPFNAPQRYWDLYKREDIEPSQFPGLPENVHPASLHDSAEFNRYLAGDEFASLEAPLSDAYARQLIHAYYASISYTDALVGRLLAELERLQLDDNTVVVLWSDHGWLLGEYRTWGKHVLFEQALRSPLIIRLPVVQGGKAVSEVVSTVDVYPTLMELCKVDMPDETDGVSLLSLLNGQGWVDKPAFSFFRNGLSMRTDRYRLTRYARSESPSIELFDHQVDPGETRNLAQTLPQVVERLMPALLAQNAGRLAFE